MATTVKTWSELSQEEFMRLQEQEPGFEYEYGRLIPLPPVDGRQSSAWGEVFYALKGYLQGERCGRVWIDVLTYLDPAGKIRYFPDIVYLANEWLDRFDGKKVVGAPTLVVEVTTPLRDAREEVEKKANYHAAGVPWYWVANTMRRRIEEFRGEAGGYVLVSETPFDQPFRPVLFPGLEILVSPPES